MAIGIALVGAGIFAQEQHLPAIEACDKLALRAVYSRSQASAEALASKAAQTAGRSSLDVYFDAPETADRGLSALLARADIAAVAVALPIALQPAVVQQALAAGKHVISEKPVAETVATAQRLLAAYEALPTPRPLWAVAENYRYHPALRRAMEAVRALGGDLVSFELTASTLVRPDGRYFNTAWRKVPTHPGGFLLDGGVHYVAALRALLAAAADEKESGIVQVAAFSAQLQPRLPPVDSLRGIARTRGGVSGVLTLSFGTEFGLPLAAAVSTTEGRVVWAPQTVTIRRRGAAADERVDLATQHSYAENGGVPAEFRAFAAAVEAGAAAVEPWQTPAEALADLQVLEALLASGAEGGVLKEV